jgi:hypothetical protein
VLHRDLLTEICSSLFWTDPPCSIDREAVKETRAWLLVMTTTSWR